MLDASSQLDTVAQVLRGEGDFLLTCHGNPDGDALGSLLAMAHMLHDMGKRVYVYNPDPLPDNLRFLPGVDKIRRVMPSAPAAWLVILDCASPDRVGAEFDAVRPFRRSIVIDHHRTERNFGDVIWVDASAAATAELVVRLARRLQYKATPAFATCAYTGIFTDTGSFRFSNTSAEVFEAAAALVAAGAEPHRVAEEIVENQPEVRYRLLADVLATLELAAAGRVAMITVRADVMAKHAASKDMLEGFVDFPRSIRGVLAAAQLREVELDRCYKASLRSKGAVDVEAVAARFGGGGHMHAAGCTLEGTYAEARERLLGALTAAVDRAGVGV